MANSLTPMPWVYEQFFDTNGNPANGVKLFTYEAGTTTKLATYTDAAGSVSHSNPIVMNAAGRPSSPIFLQARSYKFVLASSSDTDPPATPLWTADNVAASPPFNVDLDITGVAGETLAINEWAYLSGGDGGRTAGRWYKTDADLDYASTTARVVGVVMTSATSAGEVTIRRLGRVTGLSGLTAGSLYYVSATAGEITSTAPSNPRRVGQADSTTSFDIAAEIVEPNKGIIYLDLFSARLMSGANIFPAVANVGGLLASDTAPSIQRINAATDKGVRVNWAAGSSIELQFPTFAYPPDWDDASPVTVHFMAAMAGASDTPTLTVSYFEGLGDTDAGGATAAVTGTTITEYTRTIAASDIGAHPNFASVSVTPGAHGTDVLRLYAAWIEYTRKLKSS
jgi:hypothetical protein